MPPIPTIAGVWRVTLNWQGTSLPTPRNVFHVSAPGSTDALVAAAIDGALQAGYSPDNMWAALGTTYQCNNIDVMELNGTSPSTNHSITLVKGNGTGGFLPSTAVVVSLKTAQRGARGRGRMYVGPVAENDVNDGLLSSFPQSVMANGWAAFYNFITVTAGMELVVASYRHHDAHAVTNLRIDTVLGTQRRRQDVLR